LPPIISSRTPKLRFLRALQAAPEDADGVVAPEGLNLLLYFGRRAMRFPRHGLSAPSRFRPCAILDPAGSHIFDSTTDLRSIPQHAPHARLRTGKRAHSIDSSCSSDCIFYDPSFFPWNLFRCDSVSAFLRETGEFVPSERRQEKEKVHSPLS
jgi:hypothetical protein